MPSVTIDAGILACPSLDAEMGEVYDFIDTILDWRKLLDEPWIAIYMSERASEVLFQDKLYPIRNSLKQLFAQKGVREYDYNTVARIVDSLLQITPSFETFFKVKDVLHSDATTEPDLLSINASDGLNSDLIRCLILIAILREHCSNPVLDHSLIVKKSPRPYIEVRAQIHDIDHDRDDLTLIPNPPDYFQGTVLICSSFQELIMNIDEDAIWDTARDEVGLKMAIKIGLYKSRINRHLLPGWDAGDRFLLGASFYNTAKDCCRTAPTSLVQAILRSLIETIDEIRMADTHPLRTGPGGGNPQRTRGQDKAWRRDIEHEYHLHYWKCNNGLIEFASVVHHNDFSIPG